MTNKQYFALALLAMLLGGFCAGYLLGGYLIQEKWREYNLAKENDVERFCQCSFPSQGDPIKYDSILKRPLD